MWVFCFRFLVFLASVLHSYSKFVSGLCWALYFSLSKTWFYSSNISNYNHVLCSIWLISYQAYNKVLVPAYLGKKDCTNLWYSWLYPFWYKFYHVRSFMEFCIVGQVERMTLLLYTYKNLAKWPKKLRRRLNCLWLWIWELWDGLWVLLWGLS